MAASGLSGDATLVAAELENNEGFRYMANYRVVVQFDQERSVFVARAPELEHCAAEGVTRAEALQKVEEEIQAQLANMRERGGRPPAALDDDLASFSGELKVRVSRGLHRDLAWQARVEGIDLGQLVGELLAGAIDARRQRGVRRAAPHAEAAPPAEPRGERDRDRDREPRDDRRRGYGGGGGGAGRYHQILEDRAAFLEYVRQLEQGGGAPPRRGGGGPGPGPRRGRDRDRGGRPPYAQKAQGGGRPDREEPAGGEGRGPGGGPGGGDHDGDGEDQGA